MKRLGLFFAVLLFAHCSSSSSKPGTQPGTDAGPEDDADSQEDGSVEPGTCPKTGKPTTVGSVSDPEITETSGIGVSTYNAGTFWIHNDSGDTARTFAISTKGALKAVVNFDKAAPDDIEDMAIGDEGGTSYLYFGDIGDNGYATAKARTSLTIHRFKEPKLGASTTIDVTSETMTVKYADGPHNCETLLFDPITKDLLLATKLEGGPSDIHRIGKFTAGATVTTKKIASVPISLATGGEISRDGSMIGIRNYSSEVFLWKRGDGETIEDALARPACKGPVGQEPQGEALDFLPDGTGYVTISEGAGEAIHQVLFQ